MDKRQRPITLRLVVQLMLAVVVIPFLPLLISRHWNW